MRTDGDAENTGPVRCAREESGKRGGGGKAVLGLGGGTGGGYTFQKVEHLAELCLGCIIVLKFRFGI